MSPNRHERLSLTLSIVYTVASFAIGVLVGCGGYSQQAHLEKVVPAAGVLTFQGKPLEHYQVVCRPTDGRRTAIGVTDASGRFTLGTNKPGDGAPAGNHKVAVVWVGPPIQSQPGQETIIDDPSKLPKPKFIVPAKYGNPETSGLTLEVPAKGASELKIDLK